MHPVLIRVRLTNALGSLEGVHDVGQVAVGVALVHQRVELYQSFHDGKLSLVELVPVFDLVAHKVDGLVLVHQVVGLLDPALDVVFLVVRVLPERLNSLSVSFWPEVFRRV